MTMTSAERTRRYVERGGARVRDAGIARAKVARAERSAYVAAYKLERGCADCGYNGHACALDLDHRDPTTKSADVAYLVSTRAAWPRLEAELAKCDVVCANCHRVRTHVARGLPDDRYADEALLPRPDGPAADASAIDEADLHREG